MNLLITGAWSDAKDHINQIEAHGHHVLFMQQEKAELPCDPSQIEGVICNGLFLYHDIHDFENLRFIQLISAGYDRVPMDYINEKGIEIYNARGVYSAPMAEHAVMGILELYRKARLYHDYQTKMLWKKERTLFEINGKAILIVGCGSVGTECAKRLKAFGASIKGIDLCPHSSEFFEEMLPIDFLDQFIRTADIVILTVPLTEQTVRLMSEVRIGLMKKTSILVNISRGKVIDETALTKVLLNGNIYGAFLDVFEDEPLDQDSDLWKCENTIITPHVSFIGDGNAERIWNIIQKNLF